MGVIAENNYNGLAPFQRRAYEALTRIMLKPASIVEIESAALPNAILEEFIRESFELAGIDISKQQELLVVDPNYLTVTLYNDEYNIDGDGRVTDSEPQMVYQVGIYNDLSEIPIISQGRYKVTDDAEVDLPVRIKELLGVDSQNVIKSAYVTRLGTNKEVRQLSRRARRMKLAQWMKDSIHEVTDYPAVQDVEIVFFETTGSRAETFEIAIGKPVHSLKEDGIIFNKEAYPIDAIATDDYVIKKDKEDLILNTRLSELRTDLQKFLENSGYRTHTEIKNVTAQTALWQDFLTIHPNYAAFAQKYLNELSVDRASIYWFIKD